MCHLLYHCLSLIFLWNWWHVYLYHINSSSRQLVCYFLNHPNSYNFSFSLYSHSVFVFGYFSIWHGVFRRSLFNFLAFWYICFSLDHTHTLQTYTLPSSSSARSSSSFFPSLHLFGGEDRRHTCRAVGISVFGFRSVHCTHSLTLFFHTQYVYAMAHRSLTHSPLSFSFLTVPFSSTLFPRPSWFHARKRDGKKQKQGGKIKKDKNGREKWLSE